MSNAIELTSANFDQEVLQSPTPVIVDFWAPWCGPCRMISPVLDEIARERDGAVKIAKVNVDENQELASVRFKVQSIPLLLFFNGGELKAQHLGATNKQTILAKLDSLG
jgi:thioredoxin 1